MRTTVTFDSDAFNTSEPRSHYLNPQCFGDDVVRWLLAELAERDGVTGVSEPDQEDFGWYGEFTVDGVGHTLVVGFQPGDSSMGGRWIVTVERSRGLLGSLLGRRRAGVSSSSVQALRRVLTESPMVRNVLWHKDGDIDADPDDAGTRTPHDL